MSPSTCKGKEALVKLRSVWVEVETRSVYDSREGGLFGSLLAIDVGKMMGGSGVDQRHCWGRNVMFLLVCLLAYWSRYTLAAQVPPHARIVLCTK